MNVFIQKIRERTKSKTLTGLTLYRPEADKSKTLTSKGLNTFDLLKLKNSLNLSLLHPHFLKTDVIKQLTLHTPSTYIFNLDNDEGKGTHWVALGVKNNEIFYFDSFGSSYPPIELKRNKIDVFRNNVAYQNFSDPPICGHLCIAFCYLFEISRGDVDFVLEEMKNKKIVQFIHLNLAL